MLFEQEQEQEQQKQQQHKHQQQKQQQHKHQQHAEAAKKIEIGQNAKKGFKIFQYTVESGIVWLNTVVAGGTKEFVAMSCFCLLDWMILHKILNDPLFEFNEIGISQQIELCFNIFPFN